MYFLVCGSEQRSALACIVSARLAWAESQIIRDGCEVLLIDGRNQKQYPARSFDYVAGEQINDQSGVHVHLADDMEGHWGTNDLAGGHVCIAL